MRLLVICFILIGFSGCLYKSNVISIDAYKPKLTSVSNKLTIQKAYIKSVIDERTNEKVIGKVKTKNATHPLYSKTSIKLWIYDALEKELRANDYTIIDKPLREAAKFHIAIKDIKVIYDESIAGHDNLEGYIVFKLTFNKNWNKKTKYIKRKKTTLFAAPPSQSELENFIQSILNDAIRDVVQKAVAF